ncbi:lipase family alpha/beta hydrolase [Roseateles toxinivorans]|nr:putative lipase [Roseateles toxinivorans]
MSLTNKIRRGFARLSFQIVFGLGAFAFAIGSASAQRTENTRWFKETSGNTAFVFVHGLFSNSTEAFTAENGTFWPQLLGSDTRFHENGVAPAIYLGGYYTAPSSSIYDVPQAADDLLQSLRSTGPKGEEAVLRKSNIVFIAHSTGGLVVRYMIEKHREQFKTKRVGLVLMASPSRGSAWSNRLEAIRSVFGNRMAGNLARDGELVMDLDRRFSKLVDDKTIPLMAGVDAFENKFIIKGFFGFLDSERLVKAEDTASYFGAFRIVPDTDHFSIVKPDRSAHPSHSLVVDFYETKFRPLLQRSPAGTSNAKEVLSRILQTTPQRINLNLPPAAGRLPGTLLVRRPDGTFDTIRPSAQTATGATPVEVVLDLPDLDWAVFGASQFTTRPTGRTQGTIRLTSPIVLEVPQGLENLRSLLLKDETVLRQRKNGIATEVVTRALEASLIISLQAPPPEMSEFLAQAKARGAKQLPDGTLVITSKERLIVAYETSTVKYITESLGPGLPTEVQLQPMDAPDSVQTDGLIPATGLKVGFMAFGTESFRSTNLGDLPAARASIETVVGVFEALGAKRLQSQKRALRTWSEKEVLQLVREAKEEARSLGLDAIALYYVGHSALGADGHPYIITGNFKEEVDELMGGSFDIESFQGVKIEYPSDAGELASGLQAGGDREPTGIPNTIALQRIYDAANKDLPKYGLLATAILIDGCSAASVEGQTAMFYDDEDMLDAWDSLTKAQKAGYYDIWLSVAQPTFLSDQHPVILATPPGRIARISSVEGWGEFSLKIGPIAAALVRQASKMWLSTHDFAWSSLLEGIVEIDAVNLNSPEKIFSMSSFSTWSDPD